MLAVLVMLVALCVVVFVVATVVWFHSTHSPRDKPERLVSSDDESIKSLKEE